MTTLSQGCHNLVTRLSQPSHKVVTTLSQGCHKLVNGKFMKLSVGCHNCHKVVRSQPVLLPCNKLVTTCDSFKLAIEKMNEQFQI